MNPWVQVLLTIFGSVFASGGFWALIQAKGEKKSAKTKMILGLGHDRIIFLCKEFIKQGWISPDDYENLHEYLYEPYKLMGGNGTAERLMEEVKKLPSTEVKKDEAKK